MWRLTLLVNTGDSTSERQISAWQNPPKATSKDICKNGEKKVCNSYYDQKYLPLYEECLESTEKFKHLAEKPARWAE